jgi:hypothetical protein
MACFRMNDERLSGPTIRWGWLATGLAIFSAACLTTLIIVIAVKGEALATAALALAVLAFSAQLIVTLAQDQQFGQLNADTKSALTEMRATTSSLLTNQSDQFDRLLRFVLEKVPGAVEDAVEDVTSADDEQESTDESDRAAELESALQTRLEEALRRPTRPPDVVWSSNATPKSSEVASLRAQRQREWKELMAEYPSRAEGEPVVEIIRKLPPQAIATLGRVAANSTTSTREDRSVNYRRRDDQISEVLKRLIETGLLEKLSEVTQHRDGSTSDRYKLTPTGIIAARILRGQGNPPEWAADMA